MPRLRPLAVATAASFIVLHPLLGHAAIIAPAGLAVGDKFRLVFVTSGLGTALSSDIATYDNFVASEAAAAGIDVYDGHAVDWRALVSTKDNPATAAVDPVSAISRFNPTTGIFRLDGTRVAADGADLWTTSFTENLEAAINITAQGTEITPSDGFFSYVWTGTTTNGAGSGNKALGGAPDANATVGVVARNRDWIDTSGGLMQETELSYYAFSNELTVALPEPASGALAIAAIATVARRRRSIA